MRQKLRERGFPASEIVPFASERSEGKELDGVPCRVLADETIQGFDLALFSAGATTSRAWAQKFVDAGAVVVDNSSAFRRDPEIPLVVSEVNPDALHDHRGLIANPNCSTMQLMVALKPIYDAAGIDRLIVSTYQSVSGTGVKAVRELEEQTRAALAGESLPDAHGLSAPDRVQRAGRRRQLRRGRRPHRRRAQDDVRDAQDPRRRVDPDRGHVRARARAQLSFGVGEPGDPRRPVASRPRARCWPNMPGLTLVDDPATHGYPTALSAAGRDEVFVGRLRRDPTPPARAADVGRQRQPAQGRGDQRGPDCRSSARTWARAGSGCRLERVPHLSSGKNFSTGRSGYD